MAVSSPEGFGVKDREIYGLDILRFLAAAFVMLSHLAWGSWADPRGSSEETAQLVRDFEHLGPVVRIGWIGVQIFFVISGFVIIYSANGISAWIFAKKRFLRLFPGVLVCALIGCIFLVAGGMELKPLLVRLINSISFSPLGPWIANSYWTLSVEIFFYFLVFVLIAVNAIARIETFSILLAVISAVFWAGHFLLPESATYGFKLFQMNNLTQRLLLQYGCFFSLGITFWLAFQFKWTGARVTLLGVNLVVGSMAVFGEAQKASEWFGIRQSGVLALGIWLAAMWFFWISIIYNRAFGHLLGRSVVFVRLIGRATYPLYLIHQPVGETCMMFLHRSGVGSNVALIFGISISIILSLLVAAVFEPRVRLKLDKRLGALERFIPKRFMFLTAKRAPIAAANA